MSWALYRLGSRNWMNIHCKGENYFNCVRTTIIIFLHMTLELTIIAYCRYSCIPVQNKWFTQRKLYFVFWIENPKTMEIYRHKARQSTQRNRSSNNIKGFDDSQTDWNMFCYRHVKWRYKRQRSEGFKHFKISNFFRSKQLEFVTWWGYYTISLSGSWRNVMLLD